MSNNNNSHVLTVICPFCNAKITGRPPGRRKRKRGGDGDDSITHLLRQHQTKKKDCVALQVGLANSRDAKELMNLRLPILYESILDPHKTISPIVLADSVKQLRNKYPFCSKASIEGRHREDVSIATGEPLPISQADLVNKAYGADAHFIDAGVKACLGYRDHHEKDVTTTSCLLVSSVNRDNNDASDDADNACAFMNHNQDDDNSTGTLEEERLFNAIERAEREYNPFADGSNWTHIRNDDLPAEVAIQPQERPPSPISLYGTYDNDHVEDEEDEEYQYNPPSPSASRYLYRNPITYDTNVADNTNDVQIGEDQNPNTERMLSPQSTPSRRSDGSDSTSVQPRAANLTTMSPFLLPTLEFFENHRHAINEDRKNYPRPYAIDVVETHYNHWLRITEPQHMVPGDQALLQCILMHDELNSPHWGYNRSLCWVQFMVKLGLMTRTASGMVIKPMKRETFMKRIRDKFFSPPFREQIVPLENKATRDIQHAKIWFDPEQNRDDYVKCLDGYAIGKHGSAKVPVCSVEDSLRDLLKDMFIFSDLDNLVVNRGGNDEKEDVFKPFESSGMCLNEFLTGSWYRDTIRRLRAHFKNNKDFETFLFYFPVALFIDKTGTDLMQRHGLEPVYITSLIIKLKIRQLYRAWRPIGFIPDQELMSKSESTAQRRGPAMKGTSCRNWHMCLKSILDELIGLERTGFVMPLQLGPYNKNVRIIPVVALIMGDAKGGDIVTGRYGSHNHKVGRQIRSCWCTFSELDNTQIQCHPILAYQTHFPSCLAYSDGYKVIEPKGFVCKEKRVILSITKRTAIAEEPDNESSESDSESEDCTYSDLESQSDSGSEGDDNTDKNKKPRSTKSKAGNGPNQPKKRSLSGDDDQRKLSRKQQMREDAINGRKPVYKRGDPLPFQSLFENEPFFDHKRLMQELDINQDEQAINSSDQLSKTNLDKVWDHFCDIYPTAEEGGRVLQLISQHQCVTSFNQLSFGGDIQGIHGATPCDPLHAIKLGLLRYSARHLLSLMTPMEKDEIDGIGRTMLRNQRQSERRWFPRSNFSHGLTSLTMLTADEWVGVIFSLAIIFRSDAGFAILEKVKKRAGTLHKDTEPDHLVQALEMLLSFEAWVFGGPYWPNDQHLKKEKYDQSVRALLDFVKEHIRRDEGYGWCVSKFHEMLHIVGNIQRNGRPSGYDSSIGERQLKNTKSASRTAQKQRYESFLTQTCHRITDRQCLLKAATAVGGILGNRDVESDDDSGDESEADDDPTSSEHAADRPQVQNIMGMAPSFIGQNRIVYVPNQNDTTNGKYDEVRHLLWEGTIGVDLNRHTYTFVCDRHYSTLSAPTRCVTDALGRFISTKLLSARKTELDRIENLDDCAIHGKQITAYCQETEESHGSHGTTEHGQNRNQVPSKCHVHVRLRAFSEALLHGRYQNKDPPETLLHKRYDHIKKHGLLIRNHHNYRSSGKWNDWVIVKSRFLGQRVNRVKDRGHDDLFIDKAHAPARLLGLVEWHVSHVIAAKPTPRLPPILPTGRDSHGNVCTCTKLVDYNKVLCMGIRFTCGVIHPCTMAKSKYCSVLFDEWHLASNEEKEKKSNNRQPQEMKRFSPYSVCVPLSSLSDRVFVVSPKEYSFADTKLEDELDSETKVYVLRDRESGWGTRF